jgi:antitoxin component YwqK of YwqJK toxin-antitoxin module
MHGNWTIYRENGEVLSHCCYHEGHLKGQTTVYYPSSQGGGIMSVSNYNTSGQLVGEQVTYYSQGGMKSRTVYDEGGQLFYETAFYDERGILKTSIKEAS